MLSLEGGGGASQTEMVEEQLGKGTAGRRNSTRGRAQSRITQPVQGSGELIHSLECRA